MELPPFQRYAEMHINSSREIFGIDLRYDEESILKLDEIIQSAWPENPPANLESVVIPFGSFLGEALRQTIGGEWVQTEQSWGIKIGDATANVFSKVQKRLLNGEEDSLSFYYQSIKKMLADNFQSISKHD